MITRRFGRTEHLSTAAIFGAAALGKVTQEEADRAVRALIEAGVNHIDVAPSYGDAELRLAPWMKRERRRFFVGCKTLERSRAGARQEMERSLERLEMDSFDLYQLHAVNTFTELESVVAPNGALEACVAARAEGLTRYLGITAHGLQAPSILIKALHEFDFDSVLVPVNARLFANTAYRDDALALLNLCRVRNVGVMAIKAVAKQPWGSRPHTYASWYEPFEQAPEIQRHINFALSQDVTGLCSVGDVSLLPRFLAACEKYAPMNAGEQEALMKEAQAFEMIFA
jgi:aryl-alcohol dehydrogenase-like predicted oxidoreductase